MKMRYFFAGFGVLFAIAVGAVTTSGVPSFLRLQALGVNTTVPAAGIINAATDVQVAGVSVSANVAKTNTPNTFTSTQQINASLPMIRGGSFSDYCFSAGTTSQLIEFPNSSSIWSFNGDVGDLRFLNNLCFDGTNWRRITANPGSMMEIDSSVGAFSVSYAATGAAGSIATPNTAFQIDASGNISTPAAGTVPWPSPSNLGVCQFHLTYAGAAAPTIISSRGCGTVSTVRNAAGNYTINGSTLTSSMGVICSLDQNSFLITTLGYSSGSFVIHTLSAIGTQADPTTGTSACVAGL